MQIRVVCLENPFLEEEAIYAFPDGPFPDGWVTNVIVNGIVLPDNYSMDVKVSVQRCGTGRVIIIHDRGEKEYIPAVWAPHRQIFTNMTKSGSALVRAALSVAAALRSRTPAGVRSPKLPALPTELWYLILERVQTLCLCH